MERIGEQLQPIVKKPIVKEVIPGTVFEATIEAGQEEETFPMIVREVQGKTATLVDLNAPTRSYTLDIEGIKQGRINALNLRLPDVTNSPYPKLK